MNTYFIKTAGLVLSLCSALPFAAHAGCWGDHCANQRHADEATGAMLRSGATYPQIGQTRSDILWGTPGSSNFNDNNPSDSGPGTPLTLEQQAELDRLNRQTAALLDPNSMVNQTIWSSSPPRSQSSYTQNSQQLQQLNQQTAEILNGIDRQMADWGYQ